MFDFHLSDAVILSWLPLEKVIKNNNINMSSQKSATHYGMDAIFSKRYFCSTLKPIYIF